MRRFLPVLLALILVFSLCLSGCTGTGVDRSKELQAAMKDHDKALSAYFTEDTATFEQVSAFLKEWAGNVGMKVVSDKDTYLVLRNPATEGMKDERTTTLQCNVDPQRIHQDSLLLSTAMACLLGPLRHGKIDLIVTQTDRATDSYIGAEDLGKKNLKKKHLIHMEMGSSAMVYTSGALSMDSQLSCKAKKKEPEYTQAYEIRMTIPKGCRPYIYGKENNVPNPVDTIGGLLASAKSSGRLFEIASFEGSSEDGYLPDTAAAVVVIDENNVEAFTKRFESSFESIEKKFEDLKGREFTYTMTEIALPEKVLKQSVSNNIISLMYTLQTGITKQNEETGEIESASYIRDVSTSDGKFRLTVSMRSLTAAAMNELSGTYHITSGLSDINYEGDKAKVLWKSKKSGRLNEFFLQAVDKKEDTTPVLLAPSECEILDERGKELDMICYRINKDHRGSAIKNILAYMSGEDVPE